MRGLVFVGSRTPHAAAMEAFVEDVLGLSRAEGSDAAFFALPDGSRLAVQATEDLDPAERTVGLLVADADAAVAELQAAGTPTSEVHETERFRYAHFRAPDGALWELVEERR